MNKSNKKFLDAEVKRLKKVFSLKAPVFSDKNKLITLYHGTSYSNFQKILKEGIKPRHSKKSNWEGIGISRPDLVYLTNCYACYYAVHAMRKKNEQAVILKIKIDPKKIKLYPDEEFIYHLMKYYQADNRQMAIELYKTINPKKLNPIITSKLARELSWLDSLNFMGTVSCDYIPVKNILSYAILEKKDYLFCDPTISPVNYKICSREYIYQLKKLKYHKLNNKKYGI
jgi:hypothetical protein